MTNMKNIYVAPYVEVQHIDAEDVIRTSGWAGETEKLPTPDAHSIDDLDFN